MNKTNGYSDFLSISKTIERIKKIDPDTALTKSGLRRLCKENPDTFSVIIGETQLISFVKLINFLLSNLCYKTISGNKYYVSARNKYLNKIKGGNFSMKDFANFPLWRTIAAAVAELKKADPESALTVSGVRRLIEEGAIPYINVGNRILLDMHSFEVFTLSYSDDARNGKEV